MTEADLYPHLAHLSAGRCTRMWSPAGWQAVGGASVGGFQPDFIGVSGRDGRQAESSVSVQIDVYAGTVTQARQIRQDARSHNAAGPGSVSEMQDYIPKTAVTVQPRVSGHGDFFFFTNPYPAACGFYYQEAECLLCMNAHS